MSGATAKQPKTRAMKHDPYCQSPDCSGKYYAKGYCRKHWERNHMSGDPLAVQAVYGSVGERLRHYSKQEGDCVVFTGYRDRDGYGHMKINNRDVTAHRVAYELERGASIPDGIVIRHRCDNPPCVNVAHLEPGSHADNGNDKAIRLRSTYGEKNPSAHLTEVDVMAIRAAIQQGVKQRDLAHKYGVGQSTISRIKRMTSWRYLLDRGTA